MSNTPFNQFNVQYAPQGVNLPNYQRQSQIGVVNDDIELSPQNPVLLISGDADIQVTLPPLAAVPIGYTYTLARQQDGDPLPVNVAPYPVVTLRANPADVDDGLGPIQRAYNTAQWWDTQSLIVIRDALGWTIASHNMRSSGVGNAVLAQTARQRSYTTTYLYSSNPFQFAIAAPGTPVPVQSANLVGASNMAGELGSWDPATGIFTCGQLGRGVFLVTTAIQVAQDGTAQGSFDVEVNGAGTIYDPALFSADGLAVADAVWGVSTRQAFNLSPGDELQWTIDATQIVDVTFWSFNATIEALF